MTRTGALLPFLRVPRRFVEEFVFAAGLTDFRFGAGTMDIGTRTQVRQEEVLFSKQPHAILPSMSSIATRTGDDGSTALLFGRRVRKDHPLVEAYGTVDELNAALGLARASATDPWVCDLLLTTQKDLVTIMGELAVADEDLERYQASKLPKVNHAILDRLDCAIADLEERGLRFEGWATPGATLHAAHLEVARTICRRAERRIASLNRGRDALILQTVNRLSDTLWLLARLAESPA